MKETNPKDSVGVARAPLSTVPGAVMFELGLALLEGARKYGRHNWRAIGIRESVYYDAALRHLFLYWEGEDIDHESGLSHITKAIAGLVVLRDGVIRGNTLDDRPPKTPVGWMAALNKRAEWLIKKYPESKKAYCEKSGNDEG